MLGRPPHLALIAVGLAALLTGCGDDRSSGGGSTDFDSDRMHEVAADEDATPAEIIEAGTARRMAASGAGQTLVAYLVESDDDEGPQASAWRLYDADGARIADGPGTRVFEASALFDPWPLEDGFLIFPEAGIGGRSTLQRIDADGGVTAVAGEKQDVPTEAGDVLVQSFSGGAQRLYRPADDTTYPLRLPGVFQVLDLDIDDDGGIWVLQAGVGGAVVGYSANGREPWRELPVEVPRGDYPISLDVVGDQVFVPLGRPSMDDPQLSTLLVQDTFAPGLWQPVDIAGLDTTGYAGPLFRLLPDGRILVGDFSSHYYAGSPSASAPDWVEIEPPDGEDPAYSLEAAGERLYAVPVVPGPTYVSDDLGQTWEKLAR
ncbi:MAG: hypothetical protein WKF79_06295 [Nocardioides sp.]